MICDTLAHWRMYDFGPAWAEVMTWLETHGATAAPGRHEAGGCTVMVSEATTKRLDSTLFETHQAMADVQIVFEGAEWLYTADAKDLALLDDFDDVKDIGFHVVPPVETSRVTLVPGTFTLLLPWDAHMPLVAVNNVPAPVRKAVAKIPVDKLRLHQK